MCLIMCVITDTSKKKVALNRLHKMFFIIIIIVIIIIITKIKCEQNLTFVKYKCAHQYHSTALVNKAMAVFTF